MKLIIAGLALCLAPFCTAAGQVSDSILLRLNSLEARLQELERNTASADVTIFERYRRGVVRVNSGLGHGSGFLVDAENALIVTNDHVLADGQPLSVTLDASTRVAAQVIARDPEADLAVVRIHPDVCPHCPELPLVPPGEAEDVLLPGERVVAIGFPLNQQTALTSGVVSSVRERAIMSDVNLNPGNSGGPLIDMSGHVVGVNTFLDDGPAGPGISGSVTIQPLRTLLEQASDSLPHSETPVADRLPVDAGPSYPVASLRAIVDTITESERYDDYVGRDVGHFTMSLTTPVDRLLVQVRYEEEVARERRRREERAGLPSGQRFSGILPQAEWTEYVSDFTRPVVTLHVTPKSSETTGSAIARGIAHTFGGMTGAATYRFEGDVFQLELYRNRELVQPIVGGTLPLLVNTISSFVQMRDVAYEGYFVFPPETFAPGPGPIPPRISIAFTDLKHPQDSLNNRLELPPEFVAQLWNDFNPYYQQFDRDHPVVVASLEVSLSEGTLREFELPYQESIMGILDVLTQLDFVTESHTSSQSGAVLLLVNSASHERIRVVIREQGREKVLIGVLADSEAVQRTIVEAIAMRLVSEP